MSAPLLCIMGAFLVASVQAMVQITIPASLAITLMISPQTSMRWVFDNKSPKAIAILIKQESSDKNASDIGIYTANILTESSTIRLNLTEAGGIIKGGNNVSIAILDPTNSPDDIQAQPVLDSVGPLLLIDGGLLLPSSATNTTMLAPSGASRSSTPLNATTVHATNTTSHLSTSSKPQNSTGTPTTLTIKASYDGITDAPSSQTSSTKPTDTITTTSDAERLFAASAIYMGVMLMLGLPAFWLGLRR